MTMTSLEIKSKVLLFQNKVSKFIDERQSKTVRIKKLSR